MLIIDRFEGEWAVVEYQGKTFNFPKELLPSQAKEGDLIEINVSINVEGTGNRAEKIKKLADDLFED